MSVHRDIARLAARQKGYVTWAQLLQLGLTKNEIRSRIKRGILIKVHRGVYAVGHLPQSQIARAYAAVLACGPQALLSHGSAATLWNIHKRWQLPFEITAPTYHDHPGIKTHRSSTLYPRDTTTQRGIRVTSPARTLLDIAPRLSDKQLTRAVNDLRLAGYLQPNDFAELVARSRSHAGAPRLRPFAITTQNPTRSDLEDRFIKFCAKHGLPTPEINARLNGYEVDALFRAEKLIAELDGYEFHKDKATFESDRERDAAMLEIDHITVRVTDERMKRTPVKEAARLQRILESRLQV
jgi:hypothetical protein